MKENNISWKGRISRELRPAEAIFVRGNGTGGNATVFIIVKRTQNTSGSTDEKLGACDFKRQQYEKLLQGKCNVKIIYLLGSWFDEEKYNDLLNHIRNSGCDYCSDYNALFQKLGLPY